MSVTAASLGRRRAQEKIVREREDFLKEECNATYVAQWEERTSIRIEKQDILNRADRLAELDKKSLKERQKNVWQLYEKDESEWRVKLEELQHVSTDDRMNHIREKALRLKEKRENERQDFVNECYERQWRDGCDELRKLNAKAVTDRVMRDRTYAFDIKTGKKRPEGIEDTKKNKEKEHQTKQTEEQTKVETIRKNLETKAALDLQVKCLRQKNEILNQNKRIEEQKKLDSWKMADDREREKELQAQREARIRGEEILKANAERLQNREKDKAVQRRQDLVLLEYALRKEQQEIQNEQKQKNQGKEVARDYLTFLKEQMVKEKEDGEVVDNIRNEEMERILTKRELKMHEKSETRRQLMSEVNASRVEQIREKERRKHKEKQELDEKVAKNILEWDRQEKAEKDEALRKKQETIQNMLANKAVMEEKAKQRAKEKQDELLLQKHIQNDEKNHMERVRKNAGNVVTYFPRQSSKMFS